MTGEIADGCVMNYCVGPEYNDKALELMEYTKRGCTCPILYPVGGNFKLLIDTFAQK